MAAPPTVAQQLQAYVAFEARADHNARGARTLAKNRSNRLSKARKLALGGAIIAVDWAAEQVDVLGDAIESWDLDTQTADVPKTAQERHQHDGLIQALGIWEGNLDHLINVQEQHSRPERGPSINLSRHLRDLARSGQVNLRAGVYQYLVAVGAAVAGPQAPPAPQTAPAGETSRPSGAVSPPPSPPGGELADSPAPWTPSPVGWVGLGICGGKGAFAQVQLYVRQDHAGGVMNRVIVRDTQFTGGMQHVWQDGRWFWARDRKGNEIPSEIKAMYDLRSRTEYVARIINWRIDRQRKLHRIFMEFCPRGDLASVWSYYKDDRARYVPEPFIWYCAEALAEAGVIMLQGELENNPVSDWVPIIHWDLKTQNVLLGDPLPYPYAEYPVPKLADFGFAAYNRKDGDHASWNSLRVGTHGCSPPEAFRKDKICGPLTSKSDVWSLGCCLASLMWETPGIQIYEADKHGHYTHEQRMQIPNEALQRGPDGYRPRLVDDDDLDHYSEPLKRLIEDCMAFYPDERPSFPELLKTIRQHRDDWNMKLRAEPKDGLRWNHNNRVSSKTVDHFPIGAGLGQAALNFARARGKTTVVVPAAPDEDEYRPDDDEHMGGVAGADLNQDE